MNEVQFGVEKGGIFTLKTEIVRPYSINEVFEFFSKAENLEVLTPEFLNFQIKTPLPIEMKKGAIIDYRIYLYGIPINWRTNIISWEPPNMFIDKQIKGPYLLWEHTHSFSEEILNGNKQTKMVDFVKYRVPGGWIVNKLFIERELRKIFKYRSSKMLEIFP